MRCFMVEILKSSIKFSIELLYEITDCGDEFFAQKKAKIEIIQSLGFKVNNRIGSRFQLRDSRILLHSLISDC